MKDQGWVSCEVVNIYSHLKSRERNDVKFSIGNEKFDNKNQRKINPVNNEASNKSRAPIISANGVQLVYKKSDKGRPNIDIAIATHYLGE